jgi:predicted MFS family arabinose efflux permease
LQIVFGSATAAAVYSRAVAYTFNRRRGTAIAIAGCTPSLVGALGSVAITYFINEHGWRAGFLVVAAFCSLCAIPTLTLLPAQRKSSDPQPHKSGSFKDLTRMPACRLMLIGCVLVTIPLALAANSLKVLILEHGVTNDQAAYMIFLFGGGQVVGQLTTGVALDRFQPHFVAVAGFMLSVLGALMLAAGVNESLVVGAAVLLIGLSLGSEVAAIPVLVTRHFPMAMFGAAMGVMGAGLGAAMALGNIMISVSLRLTHSFDAFLYVAAALCIAGVVVFLILRSDRYRYKAAAEPPESPPTIQDALTA